MGRDHAVAVPALGEESGISPFHPQRLFSLGKRESEREREKSLPGSCESRKASDCYLETLRAPSPRWTGQVCPGESPAKPRLAGREKGALERRRVLLLFSLIQALSAIMDSAAVATAAAAAAACFALRFLTPRFFFFLPGIQIAARAKKKKKRALLFTKTVVVRPGVNRM